MTTCFGDSSVESSYYHRPKAMPTPSALPTPPLSTAASNLTNTTSDDAIIPIPSYKLLEGLGVIPHSFSTVGHLRKTVRAFIKKLYDDDTTTQYLVFRSVTADAFAQIEDQRHNIGKGLRMAHCKDIETLIIKVPTRAHETVTSAFARAINIRCDRMGLSELDLAGVNASTYETPLSCKEADAAWKPGIIRPNEIDWPTLVFETGVSETLCKLRMDASWWLSNSGDEVKIVLIFHVNRITRTILIEKWENAPRAGPVTRQGVQKVSTKMQENTISPNNVTGPSLVLEFHKIFLRQPVAPEQDIIFTTQDLQTLATNIWSVLR